MFRFYEWPHIRIMRAFSKDNVSRVGKIRRLLVEVFILFAHEDRIFSHYRSINNYYLRADRNCFSKRGRTISLVDFLPIRFTARSHARAKPRARARVVIFRNQRLLPVSQCSAFLASANILCDLFISTYIRCAAAFLQWLLIARVTSRARAIAKQVNCVYKYTAM